MTTSRFDAARRSNDVGFDCDADDDFLAASLHCD
jgi:hypothetical protein